jgi:hypothetical protein
MSIPGADQGAQHTFDYAQQQYAKENGGFFGAVVTAAESLAAAAQSGGFAVDGNTAQLINQKLSDIQDAVATAQSKLLTLGQSTTPLGQGYAQQIGQRNTQIATGGAGSGLETLAKFSQHLDELKQTISSSVSHYQGADQQGKRHVDGSGSYA